MFHAPGNRKTFEVTCKRCRRDVPTGLKDFLFQSIKVEWYLCSELCRYLPFEAFLDGVRIRFSKPTRHDISDQGDKSR